jgi:hypothetical protein
MSFFKKLFKGIVAGALIGLTGGLALAGLAGLGVTAAVTGVSIATSALFGAVSGGLSVAATAFTKKQRISTGEVQARTNISVDPQTLGKWIFGETAAGTDIVYAEKIADSEIVHVIAAAAHEIDSFGSLYINDELIALSGSAATGDWANVLDVYRNLGTQTQSALSIPSSGWPATARGLGIAHYGLKWNFASDNGKTKLSGGIPTRITQVIRGAKVYDPRLDSTNGGSGSQRANDQSTWAWSANWALIVAHYLLGWYSNSKLIYGVGVAITDIDWVSVAEMADVCDTVIDSKAKYKIGGIFAISQDHESIIGQLESAVGGKVSNFGGKYYLWCPHNDLVSAGTLTDADIVAEGGIQYTPSGPIENLFNTARGQYVEPSILYQLQPYPEVIEATAVSEDGRDRLLQQDFAMIQDVEIAQRVARELVRRSRFSGTLTVVVGPKGLLVKPFDVITVNFRETNFTNELFRVVSMQYSIGGAVILELLEEDASIYDVTTPLGTSLVQLDPTAYDPTAVYTVSGLSLTQVSVAGSAGTTIDGIKISWTQPPGFVDFTEGGFRKTGDPDYIYDRAQRGAASGVIAPVQPGTSYEVRIRHVSIAGVAGPYATASITTGTTTSIGTAVIADNAITTAKIDGGAVTNAKLDPNAVAANVFASGIQPIGIAATVPLSRTVDTIFVTADAKLYRWNGTAYIKTVDDGDITGMVVSKLTAGTINVAITTTNILQLSTDGKIYTAGKTSAASTTAGVFLGHDGGSSYDFAVGDGTKSIVWDGSAGTFTITNVNLITSGQMKATGQTTEGLETASIIAAPTATLTNGVYAKTIHNSAAVYGENSSGGSGILGVTYGTGGHGVSGLSTAAGLYGIYAFNSAGGGAFKSDGRADFDGDIIMTGATKNLVIGNATNTGNSNLVIKEGVAGSRLDNQMIVYGALSTDADTTLGIITEQNVVAGTGAFAGIVQIRIVWNGAEYWLPLQAV